MTTSRAVIQIPQVYSQPAEPGTTSFLTLIPELRNKIFELLLQWTGPILVQYAGDKQRRARAKGILVLQTASSEAFRSLELAGRSTTRPSACCIAKIPSALLDVRLPLMNDDLTSW
jgi:hypothetical protein